MKSATSTPVKTIFKSLLLSAFYFIIVFPSCKKEHGSTPALTANNAPYVNVPQDGSGYFSEIKVITSDDYNLPLPGGCIPGNTKVLTIANKNNSQQLTVGKVIFSFYDYSFWDEGNASYNGHSMAYAPSGCVIPEGTAAFVSGPSDTVDFGNFTTWAFKVYQSPDSFIQGFTFDSLDPSITASFTDNFSFPEITDIANNGTVSTKGSYTLSAYGNVTGDSVLFVITGPDTTISAVQGPNAGSYTFTNAQMASLGTTNGNRTALLQIVPYCVRPQMVSGFKCYILKEACLSKYVVLE